MRTSRRAVFASLAALTLAACEVDHHIALLLGPDDQTLTQGFSCLDPTSKLPTFAAPGVYDATAHTLSFTLVIDVIDLGDTLPTCLGEDVVHTCAASNACTLAVADAPTRACAELVVPDITDVASAPQKVRDYLRANVPEFASSAPHRPIMIRAVATTQPCAELTVAQGAAWPALAAPDALGCAYSCPIDLDTAPAQVTLGLGVAVHVGSADCLDAMRACATFPD